MGLIEKSDLFYKDYSWTVYRDDDPKVSGEPDSTLLSRKEGYEVLYFINKFCEKWNLKQKSSATKVEKMLRNDVPTNIHSQSKIKDWIETNWGNYNY